MHYLPTWGLSEFILRSVPFENWVKLCHELLSRKLLLFVIVSVVTLRFFQCLMACVAYLQYSFPRMNLTCSILHHMASIVCYIWCSVTAAFSLFTSFTILYTYGSIRNVQECAPFPTHCSCLWRLFCNTKHIHTNNVTTRALFMPNSNRKCPSLLLRNLKWLDKFWCVTTDSNSLN